MKRKIALVLSIIMLVALLLPTWSFAADSGKGLEALLKSVKAKFTIPDNLRFDYNVYTDNNKNVWYLSWQSKDDSALNINVRAYDDGTILGYDYWKPYDNSQPKRFPKVSKQEAKKLADAFIKKIAPEYVNSIRYQEINQMQIGDTGYYFSYVRVENGVLYYNNYLSVNINKETGEVNNYYRDWTDGLTFPPVSKEIGLEKAQQAFEDKIGLKIIYKYSYEENAIKLFAVYTPKFDGVSYAIDALTGEKIRLGGGYYGPYYNTGMAEMKMKMSADSAAVNLTPEELKAIEEVSKIIDKADAEKIARDSKYLGLTEDYKLEGSNLSRAYPSRNKFYWYLSFSKKPVDKESSSSYVSATIDAVTGELEGFNTGYNINDSDTAKYDKDAAKAAAEAFLKELKPDLYSQLEYDENTYDYPMYTNGVAPKQYSFRYTRKVNNATFPDNYMMVDYDAVNGKIVGFNMNWFDVEFPTLKNAIPESKVYEVMFSAIGLELQYKPKYVEPSADRPVTNDTKPEMALVYSLKPAKPAFFDVNTGVITDYDGKPYKETKAVEYSDIKGHYAEKQITALAENGIYLDGTEFKPDQYITQKDYLILVSKIMNNYYYGLLTSKSTAQEVDNFYSFLTREGVIKAGEKNPEGTVTREDAVKFFIRVLKYAEVAEIKGIYNMEFKDKNKISPDLVGYMAIAKGLGIVQGTKGYVMPKTNLKRADAAIMIYNYLQR